MSRDKFYWTDKIKKGLSGLMQLDWHSTFRSRTSEPKWNWFIWLPFWIFGWLVHLHHPTEGEFLTFSMPHSYDAPNWYLTNQHSLKFWNRVFFPKYAYSCFSRLQWLFKIGELKSNTRIVAQACSSHASWYFVRVISYRQEWWNFITSYTMW